MFDRPIGDYELTQVKLGRMAAVLQASRQFSYVVARLMAKGEGTMEAAMVKAYVCRAAEWVTRGHADPRWLRLRRGVPRQPAVRGCVLSIFEGADEVLCLRVIARRLIEQAGRA